jgi:hypothetical protein
LEGGLGSTGGSIDSCNAYVVLDDSGNGMTVNPCGEAIQSDISGDCKVDIEDFAIMASEWLDCSLPPQFCN